MVRDRGVDRRAARPGRAYGGAVTVLLLPSPLLPALAYEPLAEAMRRRGRDVRLADGSGPRSGWQMTSRWAREARDASLVVAHSNAGYLAPAVRAAARSDAALVLVDAALPPADGLTRLAPPDLRTWLGSLPLDDEGCLPPWTRWWGRDAVRRVVPARLLDELDAACPRVPLGYLDSVAVAPRAWSRRRNAYLVMSQAYEDEAGWAEVQGWPVRRLAGTHLHHLWEPDVVARAVDDLAGSLEAA